MSPIIMSEWKIFWDLDEDSLASLCLLLHPLDRLVGWDVDTKFLKILNMVITVIVIIINLHKILSDENLWKISSIMVAPCCGDQHSPRRLLRAIHTWIAHRCCLRKITITTMMITVMMMVRMRMESNNWLKHLGQNSSRASPHFHLCHLFSLQQQVQIFATLILLPDPSHRRLWNLFGT